MRADANQRRYLVASLVLGLILTLAFLVLDTSSSAARTTHDSGGSKAQKPAKSLVAITFVKSPKLIAGSRARVEVRVRDEGRRSLRNIVVKITGTEGVSVTPDRVKVKLLRSEEARIVEFRVAVAAGASDPKLSVTARTNG